jgi:hypothetical protein
MPEYVLPGQDRRRSPRFDCRGEARISSLPTEGPLILGKLRNLSLGGICVDINQPIHQGTRTEMVVCVNAASFRTVGLVKSLIERSRACFEFVQMSAGSKVLLADLVGQLQRLHAVMATLRAGRMETEAQLSRELGEAGLRAARFARCIPTSSRLAAVEASEVEGKLSDDESIVKLIPVKIRIDLFG